jgi:hypothetical protein
VFRQIEKQLIKTMHDIIGCQVIYTLSGEVVQISIFGWKRPASTSIAAKL